MKWIKSLWFKLLWFKNNKPEHGEAGQEAGSVILELAKSPMSSDVERLFLQALADDPIAIFKLALRVYKGFGVEQDYSLAYQIFKLLWSEDADAEFYMGEICREVLVNGEADYHQACCHYAAASEMGNPQAKMRLRETAELTGDKFWLEWSGD